MNFYFRLLVIHVIKIFFVMICCEEGEEYTPYGRTIVKKHPSYENKKNNEVSEFQF